MGDIPEAPPIDAELSGEVMPQVLRAIARVERSVQELAARLENQQYELFDRLLDRLAATDRATARLVTTLAAMRAQISGVSSTVKVAEQKMSNQLAKVAKGTAVVLDDEALEQLAQRVSGELVRYLESVEPVEDEVVEPVEDEPVALVEDEPVALVDSVEAEPVEPAEPVESIEDEPAEAESIEDEPAEAD